MIDFIYRGATCCIFKQIFNSLTGIVNPLYMDSPFLFDIINLGFTNVYIEGSQTVHSNKFAFLYLKLYFVLVNSVDPDEMPYYAGSLLGLHCLPTKS